MRFLLGSLPILIAIGAGVGWYITTPETISAGQIPAHDVSVENGERMFHAGGCASCHAAPNAQGDDKLILAGGLELKTEFGTFVVPNISPERSVGIGSWSMADFVTAMMKGTRPDGAHYFPSFPYPSYARMRVEDVMDLKAYLDTLPTSFNVPPTHDLAFPYNIRRGVGVWKELYFSAAPVQPASGDALIQRGQYLVEGPGHCGECHTPRDALGGPDPARWLAGGPNPDGPGRIPNITPGGKLVGDWSAEDIAYYLETGFTPDFDSAGGSMTSVIQNISQLPAEDREAIAAYLKSVPAVAEEAGPQATDG